MVENIIGLIASAVIGWFLGSIIAYSYINFKRWTHRCFSNSRSISIHEAGHLLVYLKYCPWWNDRYAFDKFVSNIDYLTMNEKMRCGSMTVNKQKFGWRTPVNRELHKRLYLGGMAAELKFSGKKPSRWNLFLQDHLYGCCSDLDNMRALGFSRKQCVLILKEIIDDFEDEDIEFIRNVADKLRRSERNSEGTQTMLNSEIRKLAEDYRNLYN